MYGVCRSTYTRLTTGSSLTQNQGSDEHRDNSFDKNSPFHIYQMKI